MLLTIILKPNTGKEDSVVGLIKLCGERAKTRFTVTESANAVTEEREYDLLFHDIKDAKLFVYEWFFAICVPDHDFKAGTRSDLALEAEDQELINHISTNLHRAATYDIDLLDMVVSDISYDQEAMKHRLVAIEEYMKGSGIVYYQQFMKELVEVLDAREIVDKESVLAKMFNTFH